MMVKLNTLVIKDFYIFFVSTYLKYVITMIIYFIADKAQ